MYNLFFLLVLGLIPMKNIKGLISGNVIKLVCCWDQKEMRQNSPAGSAREPKTCLGRVFNFKLGCFNDVHVFIYVDTHPHL
jgi:hypothetical protein